MSGITKPQVENLEQRYIHLNDEINKLELKFEQAKKDYKYALEDIAKSLNELRQLQDEKQQKLDVIMENIIHSGEFSETLQDTVKTLEAERDELEKDIEEIKKSITDKESATLAIYEQTNVMRNHAVLEAKKLEELVKEQEQKLTETETLKVKNVQEAERLSQYDADVQKRERGLSARETTVNTKLAEIEQKHININGDISSFNQREFEFLKKVDELNTKLANFVLEQQSLDQKNIELNKRENDILVKESQLNARDKELHAREKDLPIREAEFEARERMVRAREKLLQADAI